MANENETIPLFNGELELFRIKEHSFNDVVEFYKVTFMLDEPTHKACGLSNLESVEKDAEAVVKGFLEDGVSFAVRVTQTKELVAIRVNRILTPANDSCDALVPAMTEFVRRLKTPFNVFKEWHIDCAFEFCFLATRSDYAGRGLATILSKHAIEFARQMSNGTLKMQNSLPAHVRDLKPKAICSLFSSKFTQKMGEKLGFQTFVKIPYTEFFYEGKSFAENMDPIHEYATFVAMKL